MSQYRCRCNRRDCQARRNLTKHPAEYREWPRCHACGKGRMYVDKYRMSGGKRDNPPVCTDPNCEYLYGHMESGGKFLPFHRISTRGCSGYADYVAESSMIPSRHSPIKSHDDDEAPF